MNTEADDVYNKQKFQNKTGSDYTETQNQCAKKTLCLYHIYNIKIWIFSLNK